MCVITQPDGVNVLPKPAVAESNTCEQALNESPDNNEPEVNVGVAEDDVEPSYVFESVAAVTVIANFVISPVVTGAYVMS